MGVSTVVLEIDEPVRLDTEALASLYVDHGEAGAESLLCDALEELAFGLARVEKQRLAGNYSGVAKTARSLEEVARVVGLAALADVATDVRACAARAEPASLAATTARLNRIGNNSLSAIWDPHDKLG